MDLAKLQEYEKYISKVMSNPEQVLSEVVIEIEDDKIIDLISRRRHQILVHSAIYYGYNENIISDYQWTEWANELDCLQKTYPELAARAKLNKEFSNFDPSSGFNLPYRDPRTMSKAKWLIKQNKKASSPTKVTQLSSPFLDEYQKQAKRNMHRDRLFAAPTTSNRIIPTLERYFNLYHGWITPTHEPMIDPADLYIITTPEVRDRLEWQAEFAMFRISDNPDCSYYDNRVVVDTWENIDRYRHYGVENAFFIFDEDRIASNATWRDVPASVLADNDFIVLSTCGPIWFGICGNKEG